MKDKIYKLIYIFIFFLVPSFSFSQDSLTVKSTFKPSLEFYPSASIMYGFLFYQIKSGDKNSSCNRYYNQNINVGIQLNSDIKLAKDMSIQIYAGYNRWNNANLFPVGFMIKSKINERTNELYLKFGGGYTLGKRYDDINERWLPSSMPHDYGNGSVHLQAGLEKNWHLSKSKSLSMGFLLNLQLIKSYYYPYSQGLNSSNLTSYFITYKFLGLTFAYHFY